MEALFAGFSYKGFLRFGSYLLESKRWKDLDEVFTPTITFYPVKQEDARKAPTLGISIGYSHYKSKSTSLVDVPDAEYGTSNGYDKEQI